MTVNQLSILFFFLLLSFSIRAQKFSNLDQARRYEQEHDLTRASEYVKKALRSEPKNLDALYLQAQIFIEQGSYDEARPVYLAVLDISQDQPSAHYGLGLCYLNNKNKAAAASEFETAVAGFSRHITNPQSNENICFYYSQRAEVYQYQQNYYDAAEDCNYLIAHCQPNAFRYAERAIINYNLKKFDSAVADYGRALEQDSRNPEYWVGAGAAYLQLKRYRSALWDYDQAIRLNPNSYLGYCGKGNVFMMQKIFDSALFYYNKAVAFSPADLNLYIDRGQCLMATGEIKQAIRDYTHAIRIDSTSATAWAFRSQAYGFSNSIDECYADAQLSTTLDPNDPQAWQALAGAYCFKTDYAAALQAYETEYRLSPENKFTLIDELSCLIRLHHFEEAVPIYYNLLQGKTAEILSPALAFYWSYLKAGCVYAGNREYDKALLELNAAQDRYKRNRCTTYGDSVDAVNSFTDILALKGYIFEKKGMRDSALQAYRSSLVLDASQNDLVASIAGLGSAAAGPVLPSLHSNPNYYAILIGEDEYHDKSIHQLYHCASDAQALKGVLERYYQFPSTHIRMLINRTREDILDTLYAVSTRLSGNDNLLILFSGHGVADPSGLGGYLIPSNATNGKFYSYIPSDELVRISRSCGAQHVLFLVDACYGGSLTSRGLPAGAGIVAQLAYESPSRKVMTSGGKAEVPDSSAFMRLLTRRLIDNTEDYLVAGNLFTDIKDRVTIETTNIPTYEALPGAGDQSGQFVFMRKKDHAP